MLTIRGVLEAGQHLHSSFVTLTYDDEHLPPSQCVSVRTAQLFLKMLRYLIGPFRYIICGEYGERNWRPHYHAILFGVRDGCGVASAWKKGFVHISGVGPESIAYVCGYGLKGLTSEKGMQWAGKSLSPEFVRWSRRPPIGALAADKIGAFYTGGGSALLRQNFDVSSVVRQGGKLWPLGRYLRNRARVAAGLDLDSVSHVHHLLRLSSLRSMDQSALNDHVALAEGQSSSSGFRAEQKHKRHSLERKL